jgi:WD40 repeat protein
MDFTRDEKTLITWSSETVQVISVADGAVVRKIPVATPEGAKAAIFAVHPSGETIVWVVRGGVTAMSLVTGEIVRTFYSPHLFDWAEFTGEMRKAIKLTPRGKKRDENLLPTVLEGFHITPAEFWKVSRDAMDESATLRPTYRLAFSESGKLLFSSADRALRVYDWDGLPASQESPPEPLYRLDLLPSYATSSGAESKGLILTLTEDSAAHHLLFGTQGGKIGVLDLETGGARLLLNIPGAEPIDGVALSRDRAALFVLCRKDRNDRSGRFMVWDYAKLCNLLPYEQSRWF